MNDIFLSYDRLDRVRAQKYADSLEALGWSVFWDREIPLGEHFDQVIETELNAARCVVVLWSNDSVNSRWVKTEASAAAEVEKLVPVLIDEVPIPFEFRRIQTAELWHWNGETSDPEFARLVQAVTDKVSRPKTPSWSDVRTLPPPKPVGRLQKRPPIWLAAVAVILVLGYAVLNQVFQQAPATELSDSSTGGAPLPASGGPATPATAAAIPDSAFNISIGDRIDDGVPAKGAGHIETPYSQDHYVFNARPGQTVYFRMAKHSQGMAYINWRLVDENGAQLFEKCLGCTEPGVQVLTKGGRYLLTVGNDRDSSTGAYQLQLFNVAPPDKSAVNIGDALSGAIESPGAADVYTFTAKPGQRAYFRMWEHSQGLSYINWRLADQNNMEIFSLCLGCSEPGVQTLVRGGTYTLTITNPTDPSSGTYRVQTYNVPNPDMVQMNIGERKSGSIESPGAEDVYTFTASPGQNVYFRLLDRSRGMDYIQWSLVDENGMEVFNKCLGCSEPGMQALSRGGKYTLTVGNRKNPSTGTYTFETGGR